MHLANMDRLQVGIGKNLPHSINRYALISTILSMCKKHTIPVYIHNYPLEDAAFSPDKLDLVIVSEGGSNKTYG